MRKSGNKTTLAKGLSIDEARRMVQSYPNSNKSMVCFTEQV